VFIYINLINIRTYLYRLVPVSAAPGWDTVALLTALLCFAGFAKKTAV
jgi:hypothetical protein